MQTMDSLIDAAFNDMDLYPQDIPQIDLYMDQILTLVNDGLEGNKRKPEDKLLTKTMINNYSKEHLIMPVKGKKYSREHMMQMLCIYRLKQMLAMSDVHTLVSPCTKQPLNYERVYTNYLDSKEEIRRRMPEIVRDILKPEEKDLANPEERLAAALSLSCAANYLRRLCESIVDSPLSE